MKLRPPQTLSLYSKTGIYNDNIIFHISSEERFNGHIAIDDANALARLFGKAKITNDVLSANSLTVDAALEYIQKNVQLRVEVAQLEESFENMKNHVIFHMIVVSLRPASCYMRQFK